MDMVLGSAVVIATFGGPIAAVIVTRIIDDQRDQRRRRLELFRALMISRRTSLSIERVQALNMIEIEFYGAAKVQSAHRDLMRHINTPSPLPANWEEHLRTLYTRLLTEMGATLGYNFQQLDVLEGGYYPQGSANIELEQQEVRRGLIAVLSGHRPLPISPIAPAPPAPFPPPPVPDHRGNT